MAGKRGRKSTADLAIAKPIEIIKRLEPPPILTDDQAALWQSIVSTKPADWFQADTVPLLIAYVKHYSTRAMLDRQIEQFDDNWLTDDLGLDRLKKLISMRDTEAGKVLAYARSMRLTQQSQYDAQKARTKTKTVTPGGRPWDA